MKCHDVQDVLLEHFGEAELPDEIRQHVADCADCRAVWDELSTTAGILPTDEAFHPTEADAARLATAVDRTIDGIEERTISIFPAWVERVLPVAASILLVVSVALLGGQFDSRQEAFEDRLAQTEYAWYETESTTVTSEDLDESTVRGLLEDFSYRPGVEPSEMLLEDLTEDELEYLNANFDVGDLL